MGPVICCNITIFFLRTLSLNQCRPDPSGRASSINYEFKEFWFIGTELWDQLYATILLFSFKEPFSLTSAVPILRDEHPREKKKSQISVFSGLSYGTILMKNE